MEDSENESSQRSPRVIPGHETSASQHGIPSVYLREVKRASHFRQTCVRQEGRRRGQAELVAADIMELENSTTKCWSASRKRFRFSVVVLCLITL